MNPRVESKHICKMEHMISGCMIILDVASIGLRLLPFGDVSASFSLRIYICTETNPRQAECHRSRRFAHLRAENESRRLAGLFLFFFAFISFIDALIFVPK